MHQGSTNKGFSPLRKSSHNLGAVNRHLDELADAWAIVAKEGGIIDTTIWRKISRCSLAGYMAEEEAELQNEPELDTIRTKGNMPLRSELAYDDEEESMWSIPILATPSIGRLSLSTSDMSQSNSTHRISSSAPNMISDILGPGDESPKAHSTRSNSPVATNERVFLMRRRMKTQVHVDADVEDIFEHTNVQSPHPFSPPPPDNTPTAQEGVGTNSSPDPSSRNPLIWAGAVSKADFIETVNPLNKEGKLRYPTKSELEIRPVLGRRPEVSRLTSGGGRVPIGPPLLTRSHMNFRRRHLAGRGDPRSLSPGYRSLGGFTTPQNPSPNKERTTSFFGRWFASTSELSVTESETSESRYSIGSMSNSRIQAVMSKRSQSARVKDTHQGDTLRTAKSVLAYAEALRGVIVGHEKRIKALQKERRKEQMRRRLDLEKWQKRGCVDLYHITDLLHTATMLDITASLHVEFASCLVLEREVSVVRLALNGGGQLDAKSFKGRIKERGRASRKEIRQGVLAHPSVSVRLHRSTLVMKTLARVREIYEEMKQKLGRYWRSTEAERRARLLFLINEGSRGATENKEARAIDIHLHPLDLTHQTEFESIILDQRYKEARNLLAIRDQYTPPAASHPANQTPEPPPFTTPGIPGTSIGVIPSNLFGTGLAQGEISRDLTADIVYQPHVSQSPPTSQGVPEKKSRNEWKEYKKIRRKVVREALRIAHGSQKKGGYPSSSVSCLALYADRMLTPLLRDMIKANKTKHEIRSDSKFMYATKWVPTVATPEQFGILERFCPGDAFNSVGGCFEQNGVETAMFPKAIHRLSELSKCRSASDALFCIYDTMRLVHKEARRYSTVKLVEAKVYDGSKSTADDQSSTGPKSKREEAPAQSDINADMLFPMVVWVFAHAHVPGIHGWLSIVSNLADPAATTFGQTGMALALAQAAAAHVSSLKEAEFRSPTSRSQSRSHTFSNSGLPSPLGPLTPNLQSPLGKEMERPRAGSILALRDSAMFLEDDEDAKCTFTRKTSNIWGKLEWPGLLS
ncbi:hypothetical protein AAMO2058_000957900 [Amorphochlora amoebiformis]